MIHGVRRTYSLGKHYCPYCSEKLVRVKCSKVLDARSKEAEDYHFGWADLTIRGNIKFVWDEFYCNRCQKQFTEKKLKEIEHPSCLVETQKRFYDNKVFPAIMVIIFVVLIFLFAFPSLMTNLWNFILSIFSH